MNQPEKEGPSPPPEAAQAQDAASLQTALEQERAKAQQYLAHWQRAQADFINYKRRTEEEREEVAKFARATLILSLLPVLDDLERALDSVSAKLAGFTWVDGIRLIHRKLQAILEAQGLSPIPAQGQDFDPRLHEAVMYKEGEEGKVVEELQKGYKLQDRVLRPTLVVVGRAEAKAAEAASGPTEESHG